MMESSEQELDNILAVLRAVPGVRSVSASKYTGPDLDRMNVLFRYNPPSGGPQLTLRTACSRHVPTKLKAAQVARDKLIAIVGKEAIALAEKQVREAAAIGSSMASPSPPPAAEKSTASASAPVNAFGIIGQTQQLQANVRAAELRTARALEVVRTAEAAHDLETEQMEQAKEALDLHQMRQRTAEEQAPPPTGPSARLARERAAYQFDHRPSPFSIRCR